MVEMGVLRWVLRIVGDGRLVPVLMKKGWPGAEHTLLCGQALCSCSVLHAGSPGLNLFPLFYGAGFQRCCTALALVAVLLAVGPAVAQDSAPAQPIITSVQPIENGATFGFTPSPTASNPPAAMYTINCITGEGTINQQSATGVAVAPTGGSNTVTISTLTNGLRYTCTLTARSADGGFLSASVASDPSPSSPLFTAGSGQPFIRVAGAVQGSLGAGAAQGACATWT